MHGRVRHNNFSKKSKITLNLGKDFSIAFYCNSCVAKLYHLVSTEIFPARGANTVRIVITIMKQY